MPRTNLPTLFSDLAQDRLWHEAVIRAAERIIPARDHYERSLGIPPVQELDIGSQEEWFERYPTLLLEGGLRRMGPKGRLELLGVQRRSACAVAQIVSLLDQLPPEVAKVWAASPIMTAAYVEPPGDVRIQRSLHATERWIRGRLQGKSEPTKVHAFLDVLNESDTWAILGTDWNGSGHLWPIETPEYHRRPLKAA